MPTCQCATPYRRNICTLLLGGPAHPRLPLFFQPLSHSVPFYPILSHSLFHPVPSSHSPRLRLLSTFPWTIWHAPVPPLPIQTSTRSLQSYSSLRRAASLVRAHAAALPRLRLSLSHTLPQPCCEQKTGLPLSQNVVAAKTPNTRPPIISRLAVSLQTPGRALSSTSNALCWRHPSR